jgi:hypothetical protein
MSQVREVAFLIATWQLGAPSTRSRDRRRIPPFPRVLIRKSANVYARKGIVKLRKYDDGRHFLSSKLFPVAARRCRREILDELMKMMTLMGRAGSQFFKSFEEVH